MIDSDRDVRRRPAGIRVCTVRAAMLGAALAAGTADAVRAAQLGPFDKLVGQVRDKLGGRSQRPTPANGDDGKLDIATVVAGGLGLGACKLATRDRGAGKLDLCLLAGAGSAIVARALGSAILKGVKERDREKILAGAAQAVDTGQPVLLDLPDSKVQFAIAPTGRKTEQQSNVSFAVDTASIDGTIPPLRIIGQPYTVSPAVAPVPSPGRKQARAVPAPAENITAAIYSRPDERAPHPAALAANQPVHVIGQVVGSPWLLVARWVQSGNTATPMAIGYVRETQLRPIVPAAPPPTNIAAAPATLHMVTLSATLRCEESEFTKIDARQQQTKDSSRICDAPAGKTMLA